MHAAGVRADAQTFEHIDPALVGNRRDLLDLRALRAGRDRREGRRGRHPGRRRARRACVERVKELEHEGFQFEAADGSFELLMRREPEDYEPLFRLESWRVTVEKHADGESRPRPDQDLDGRRALLRTAEGNGP